MIRKKLTYYFEIIFFIFNLALCIPLPPLLVLIPKRISRIHHAKKDLDV